MLLEITAEQAASAVERCVSEVLWEAGVARPPVDAFLVARRLGCVVVRDDAAAARARRAVLPSVGGDECEAILLAPEDRPERRHWAVAHEIGEACAARVFDYLGVGPDEAHWGAREQTANRFATCLLLPRRWLLPEGRDTEWDLAELKQAYSTASHELIARRTLELHDGPIAVTVWDNARRAWRRGNRGGAPPPSYQEDNVWRLAHQSGLPVDARGRAPGVARVRCWPVHEPHWRREIMLTEYECDDW